MNNWRYLHNFYGDNDKQTCSKCQLVVIGTGKYKKGQQVWEGLTKTCPVTTQVRSLDEILSDPSWLGFVNKAWRWIEPEPFHTLTVYLKKAMHRL